MGRERRLGTESGRTIRRGRPGGGLSVAEVTGFIRGLRSSLPVLAASVTSYDPAGYRAAGVVAAVTAELLS